MQYPYMTELDVDTITPNLYNPNVMSDEEFELLEKNIQEVGFLDPILVVPKEGPDNNTYYQIVDGEHRYEAQRVLGFDKITAIVADPAHFDEKMQKLQTVRMNQIRGSLDIVKFNNLVNDLVVNHNLAFDELATELGFADIDEFQQLVAETRRSLPNTPGLKKDFDKQVKDVKTYDDLTRLVDRLIRKYGNTLPANFMILDFSRQHNILIKMNSSTLAHTLSKFRSIFEHGYTVDSVIYHLIKSLKVEDYISKYANELEEISDIEFDSVDSALESMTLVEKEDN